MHGGFKGSNWRTERRSPLILFGPRDLCPLESSTLDFRQLYCSAIKLLCTGLIPCTLQIPFFWWGGGFAPINSYNMLTPGRWVELNWHLPDPLIRLSPTALQQASIKRSVVSVRPSVSTLSFEPTDLGRHHLPCSFACMGHDQIVGICSHGNWSRSMQNACA